MNVKSIARAAKDMLVLRKADTFLTYSGKKDSAANRRPCCCGAATIISSFSSNSTPHRYNNAGSIYVNTTAFRNSNASMIHDGISVVATVPFLIVVVLFGLFLA